MKEQSSPIYILVVDDEIDLQRLITLQFRREIRAGKVEFRFALSGEEALAVLQSDPNCEVMLCDINMPNMDGITLLSHVKDMDLMMKTIMVTAYDNMQNIRGAMNAGAFDFITKPIDFSDLKTTIENAKLELDELKAGEVARKQLPLTEEELALTSARAQALEELDQLKARFFTNISHEFRTPLTVIMGMTDQIQANPGKWQEKGHRMIRRNTAHLLDLVNQILDLRKLEAGELQVHLEQKDLVAFLKPLLESFQVLAESNEQKLRFESNQEVLLMDLDSDKLLRVFYNLLSNALKFTPEGGEISLRVIRMQDDRVQLTVSDTGVGIAEDRRDDIFARFYQVDDSSTREKEGTGIGLSLVKELVELMQGEIRVESKLGQGTHFVLSLPITNNAPFPASTSGKQIEELVLPLVKEDVSIPTEPRSGELPTLLIIEDHIDVVEYLTACLEHHYQLLVARNGQEGINIALEQVPDLIISDVMMPFKDGFEVCQQLKSDTRTSHIPIILLTAKADHEARIQGLSRGADAYLAKPFDPKELFVRLEQLLQLRRELRTRYANMQKIPEDDSSSQTFQAEDAFIQDIHSKIKEHLSDHTYGLKELCLEIGISRSNLHRKITALTGMSTSLYIRKYRLLQARELLMNESLHVSEVAYEVGFSDPAYFSRTFTQEFGFSPKQVRSQSSS